MPATTTPPSCSTTSTRSPFPSAIAGIKAPRATARTRRASSARASFDAYEWQDPDGGDYSTLADLEPDLPEGMKLIVCGPCGGCSPRWPDAENLCSIKDDETLAFDISMIGSRLVRYYRKCLEHGAVGAVIGNDDWGFRSGTMFSPADMRRFVFPWHREIVAVAHASGRPAILHSCGNLEEVMDNVIDDIGYDGKHSFEDAIQPVEEAYDQYHRRIAILGGGIADVDFVCRETPWAVHERSEKMLERAESKGSFALGTGNSVPVYVLGPELLCHDPGRPGRPAMNGQQRTVKR